MIGQDRFQNSGLSALSTLRRCRVLNACVTREVSNGSSLQSPIASAGVVGPWTSGPLSSPPRCALASRPGDLGQKPSARHAKILGQLGVHHIVRPEHDMGKRVAHLVAGRMMDYMEFEDGYAMVKTTPPSAILGRPPAGHPRCESGSE